MRWIPLSDDPDVRNRAKQLGLNKIQLRDLLLVAVSISYTKAYESAVVVFSDAIPIQIMGFDISTILAWLIWSFGLTGVLLYINPAKEAIEEVADAADEVFAGGEKE